jgi:hypothetical protein
VAAKRCGKKCGGERKRCAMKNPARVRGAQKFRNGPKPQPHRSPPFAPALRATAAQYFMSRA